MNSNGVVVVSTSYSFYAQQNAETNYNQKEQIDMKPIIGNKACNLHEESSDEADLTNFGHEFKNIIGETRLIREPKQNVRNKLKARLQEMDSDL